jgi:hypothetical protein
VCAYAPPHCRRSCLTLTVLCETHGITTASTSHMVRTKKGKQQNKKNKNGPQLTHRRPNPKRQRSAAAVPAVPQAVPPLAEPQAVPQDVFQVVPHRAVPHQAVHQEEEAEAQDQHPQAPCKCKTP